jgi:hypothetical protein
MDDTSLRAILSSASVLLSPLCLLDCFLRPYKIIHIFNKIIMKNLFKKILSGVLKSHPTNSPLPVSLNALSPKSNVKSAILIKEVEESQHSLHLHKSQYQMLALAAKKGTVPVKRFPSW